jgi:hypothetical protein
MHARAYQRGTSRAERRSAERTGGERRTWARVISSRMATMRPSFLVADGTTGSFQAGSRGGILGSWLWRRRAGARCWKTTDRVRGRTEGKNVEEERGWCEVKSSSLDVIETVARRLQPLEAVGSRDQHGYDDARLPYVCRPASVTSPATLPFVALQYTRLHGLHAHTGCHVLSLSLRTSTTAVASSCRRLQTVLRCQFDSPRQAPPVNDAQRTTS